MLKSYSAVISTPLGKMGIALNENRVIRLTLLDAEADTHPPQDPATQHAVDELNKYFCNPHHTFDLTLQPCGTPFQQKVWRALHTIPQGETRSYGELAKQLGTGPRAIGQACRTNPILVIIPCHRVVAANGIGGFGGATEGRWKEVKEWLLKHEGHL